MTAPHHRPEAEEQKGSVTTIDLADALLDAFAEVKRRAFGNYLVRGRLPGHALDDWLAAERELSPPIRVDISESEDFIQVLAMLPDCSEDRISVAIEGSLASILVHSELAEAAAAGKDSVEETPGPSSNGVKAHEMMHRIPQRHVEFFTVIELPREVDPVRSVAVFTDGLLAIRMTKILGA